MKTFTAITAGELQLTDEQLSLVVGGCGRYEMRRDCDDDDRGWRGNECGEGRRRGRRESFHAHNEHDASCSTHDSRDVGFNIL